MRPIIALLLICFSFRPTNLLASLKLEYKILENSCHNIFNLSQKNSTEKVFIYANKPDSKLREFNIRAEHEDDESQRFIEKFVSPVSKVLTMLAKKNRVHVRNFSTIELAPTTTETVFVRYRAESYGPSDKHLKITLEEFVERVGQLTTLTKEEALECCKTSLPNKPQFTEFDISLEGEFIKGNTSDFKAGRVVEITIHSENFMKNYATLIKEQIIAGIPNPNDETQASYIELKLEENGPLIFKGTKNEMQATFPAFELTIESIPKN